MLRDLSHPIRSGMTVYPGDPAVSVEPALTLDAHGAAVTRLGLGSHTGTHVDAPAHTIRGGRTLADVALDELVGEAIVLRVSNAEPERAIVLDDLAPPDTVPPIVIVETGWARFFGTERALRHPFLAPDAARELTRRGMRVLAVDTLSPDPTPAEAFPVHEIVLGGDGLIVENLYGLDGLPTRVPVGFFPLRLEGDGAPVRAVAFLDDSAR
ncbi:cyclase family protein [Microbacterium sp. SD291]|uniref:cyclase family protein n=1 Tax=Microbacterium sp. SD291 TaxID=2782007 RepID=UPI001A96AA12|nr:cyclase family protein [Microbacterium sp. SD291]MBO0980840.1 cyclase family protein [Microbacterium sp. SD291]